MNKKVLIPSISYTIHNAKEDIGNFENDLRNYVKKTDYEKDKEDLITDEELTRGNVQSIVIDRWNELFKGTKYSPIDVHTPLWLWSRNGFKKIK